MNFWGTKKQYLEKSPENTTTKTKNATKHLKNVAQNSLDMPNANPLTVTQLATGNCGQLVMNLGLELPVVL